MNNNFKKTLILSFLIFSGFWFASHAYANSLILTPSKTVASKEEEFYIDVLVDPQGSSINGIEGIINFPPTLSFVREDDGSSVVGLWMEKPAEKGDSQITLSGILPNGFSGVIDPFHPESKEPGLITRLVFKAKDQGTYTVSSEDFDVTANDGQGTIEHLSPVSTTVAVDNSDNPKTYASTLNESSTIDASVVQDRDVYDNKYILIFNIHDNGGGVKEIRVKEGNRDWKTANASPYLLVDQSRHSIIEIEAIDYNGKVISQTIPAIPRKLPNGVLVMSALLGLLIALLIYEKYKNKKPKSH